MESLNCNFHVKLINKSNTIYWMKCNFRRKVWRILRILCSLENSSSSSSLSLQPNVGLRLKKDLIQTLGPRLHFWFPNRQFFTGRGSQHHVQPRTWRTRSHIYNPWDWVAQPNPLALGTHFSRLLWCAWATGGLFFNPVTPRI